MSGARPPMIVCVGDVMVDVLAMLSAPLATGSDTEARITVGHGGSAANTAAWLGHLGVPVSFWGRVGNDAYGVEAAAALRAYGVELQLEVDEHEPTGTCIVLVTPDGERTMVPAPGANAYLSCDESALQPKDHLHVSAYALFRPASRSATLSLLDTAVAVGASISVDAASAEPLRAVGPATFLGWLPETTMLIANLDEATVLTGLPDDAAAAAATLLGKVASAVIKTGAGGAVVAQHHGIAAVAAGRFEVIDSTGAGDAFAAGLLAALQAGCDLVQAAGRANAVASQAIAVVGARPVLPGLAISS